MPDQGGPEGQHRDAQPPAEAIPVGAGDIGRFLRGTEHDIDESDRRAQVLREAFDVHQKQAHRMRSVYGYTLLVALLTEMAISMLVLILLGAGTMHLRQWVADAFFVSVFGQIVGLVLIIVRHLFPQAEHSIPALYAKLAISDATADDAVRRVP